MIILTEHYLPPPFQALHWQRDSIALQRHAVSENIALTLLHVLHDRVQTSHWGNGQHTHLWLFTGLSARVQPGGLDFFPLKCLPLSQPWVNKVSLEVVYAVCRDLGFTLTQAPAPGLTGIPEAHHNKSVLLCQVPEYLLPFSLYRAVFLMQTEV